jgi:hypothetical protein
MNNRSIESRLFPRLDFSGSVSCQVRGAKEIGRSVSEDISLSGIKFISDSFIPPQTPVMLEINLLSQVVRPIAQIVWSSPFPRQNKFHLGARFLEWDPQDKKRLNDYITMKFHQQ